MTKQEIYKLGFIDGIQCFAHWKEGKQYVGTTGMLLEDAIRRVETLYGYKKNIEEEIG